MNDLTLVSGSVIAYTKVKLSVMSVQKSAMLNGIT